jgi:hypothetical protein
MFGGLVATVTAVMAGGVERVEVGELLPPQLPKNISEAE